MDSLSRGLLEGSKRSLMLVVAMVPIPKEGYV
jgi:hypothetical protein